MVDWGASWSGARSTLGVESWLEDATPDHDGRGNENPVLRPNPEMARITFGVSIEGRFGHWSRWMEMGNRKKEQSPETTWNMKREKERREVKGGKR